MMKSSKITKRSQSMLLTMVMAFVLAAASCFTGCSMRKSTSSAANSGEAKTLDGNLYSATASNGYFLSLSFKDGQFRFNDNLSSFSIPNDKGVYGEYRIEGNTVVLPCAESEDEFILNLSGDKLYLEKDKSSSLNLIKSGMDFEEMFKNDEVCFILIEQLDD